MGCSLRFDSLTDLSKYGKCSRLCSFRTDFLTLSPPSPLDTPLISLVMVAVIVSMPYLTASGGGSGLKTAVYFIPQFIEFSDCRGPHVEDHIGSLWYYVGLLSPVFYYT